ncbi:MAG: hypothetical protein SOX36_01915 [Candidatus Cryptobacteroides sp.]|nr:hypothetical protein [Candidatus Cryptobacteroides sp.]
MKRLLYISALISMLFSGLACTDAECPENNAPEFVSITSMPDVHTAVLVSDLKAEPSGSLECGFYIGKDRSALTRMTGRVEGMSIILGLDGLDAATAYYFKAFISNGRNEVDSGLGSFLTAEEPADGGNGSGSGSDGGSDGGSGSGSDGGSGSGSGNDGSGSGSEPGSGTGEDGSGNEPGSGSGEDPGSEPGSGSDDGSGSGSEGGSGSGSDSGSGSGSDGTGDSSGGTGDSSGGTEPEPEPVEFTTEIESVEIKAGKYETRITVSLKGDAALVKKALIHLGYTADEMLETVCDVEGSSFSSIFYGLEPGVTYYYKASISNGIETKTSETFSFTVPASTA